MQASLLALAWLLLALPAHPEEPNAGAEVPKQQDRPDVRVYRVEPMPASPSLTGWARVGSQGGVWRLQESPHADVWLGLTIEPRVDGKREETRRLEVVETSPGAPGDLAGVLPGDQLVALGGRRVRTHAQVVDALGGRVAQSAIEVTVERSRPATLGERDGGGAFLGVTLGESERDGGAGKAGVRIEGVEPGSAAERAGLAAGQRIAALDGREFSNASALANALRAMRPGAKVELRIQADLEAVLAPRPSEDPSAPSESDPAPRGRIAVPQVRERAAQRSDRPRAQPRRDAEPRSSQPSAEGVRALLDELRALRGEISALRDELAELRRQRPR